MITELSAFLATTAGKLVASTAVAAVSLGGAHATNLIDLPLIADQPAAAVVTADAEVTDDVPVGGTEADGAASDPVADGSEAAADEVAADQTEGDIFGVETDDDTAADDDAADDDAADDDAADDNADENEDANHGSIVSEFAHTTELKGCERGQAIAEIASSNAADHRQNGERDTDKCGAETDDDGEDDGDADDTEDEAVTDDESDENKDANHGSIVSEFAHTTELKGCERGQAIAEIASSNAADHRQNGERDTDKCGAETDDDGDADDTAADDTAADDTAADVDASAGAEGDQTVTEVEVTTGPGNSNNGGGRPDHAGPPENAGRPDHAGGQGRGNK